jgi:hypothetical protein
MKMMKNTFLVVLLLGDAGFSFAYAVTAPSPVKPSASAPVPPLTNHERARLQHSVRQEAAVRLKNTHMANRAKAMDACVQKHGCK